MTRTLTVTDVLNLDTFEDYKFRSGYGAFEGQTDDQTS
jgi:hypothetical protein